MPRGPRIEIAGGIHHVTARAPSNRLLFVNRAERVFYLGRLAAEVTARKWTGLHLVLMTTHVHFLVRTEEENLGLGMKAVHEGFATNINKGRGEHGHLFGARFNNKPVLSARHFAATMRYIAMNPVKAGMCKRPEDHPWSAHRVLADPQAPRRGLIDVQAALDLLGMDAAGYVELVGKPNAQVMDELQRELAGDQWLVPARDDWQIPMKEIAAHLGVGVTRAYQRLAAQRL